MQRKGGERSSGGSYLCGYKYINLLIPLPGSSKELSRNSNHSPNNTRLLGSYTTSMMPKPWVDLFKSLLMLSRITKYELPAEL